MTEKKICLLPCSGMGKVMGSVSREAALLATSLHPNNILLGCPVSLAAGIPTYTTMVQQNPVIALDGCSHRCATKIAQQNNAFRLESVYLPPFIKKYNLKPKTRRTLDADGQALAKKIAEDLIAQINNPQNE